MQQLNKKQKDYISLLERHLTIREYKPFTKKQLNKLVELVACTYIYNVDMKTSNGHEQRLLKNIYFILTGNDNPENER